MVRSDKGKAAIVAPDLDALARYVPDLKDWPASWSFDNEDIPPGQAIVQPDPMYVRARARSHRGSEQHGQSHHEKIVRIPNLQGNGNRAISCTWQSS